MNTDLESFTQNLTLPKWNKNWKLFDKWLKTYFKDDKIKIKIYKSIFLLYETYIPQFPEHLNSNKYCEYVRSEFFLIDKDIDAKYKVKL